MVGQDTALLTSLEPLKSLRATARKSWVPGIQAPKLQKLHKLRHEMPYVHLSYNVLETVVLESFDLSVELLAS